MLHDKVLQKEKFSTAMGHLLFWDKYSLIFGIWMISFGTAYAQYRDTTITKEEQAQIDFDYNQELHALSFYGENHLFWNTGANAYNFGTRLDINSGVFGFYYKIGVGMSPDGKVYVHLPAGVEAGLLVAGYGLVSGSGNYYLVIPAVLCALIPEGITARVWKRNNYNLKLYASPWGAELNFSNEHFNLISGEFGVQANMFNTKLITMSCYAGTKVIYKNWQPAATVGATIGILLDQ